MSAGETCLCMYNTAQGDCPAHNTFAVKHTVVTHDACQDKIERLEKELAEANSVVASLLKSETSLMGQNTRLRAALERIESLSRIYSCGTHGLEIADIAREALGGKD